MKEKEEEMRKLREELRVKRESEEQMKQVIVIYMPFKKSAVHRSVMGEK